MNIQYVEPLSAGWRRMKKALFQPFDLGKWFTVGFTAFLASLLDGGGGGGNNGSYGRKSNADLDDLFNFPGIAMDWLNANPFWFTLIVIGIVAVFVFFIVLTWLSSRGKFMFLDNVVHDRAEVKKPWYEFRKEGNSLFLWRLVYGLLVFAAVLVSFWFAFNTAKNIYYEELALSEKVMSIFGMVIYFLILFIVTGYISLFLDSFVVPIMYKERLSTSQAWFRFLPLLSKRFGHFIVFGLFTFVLIILIVISVIIFGFITCCIGFLLLIIPYIGSVVFLPVSYTLRAFSLEYLQQFGEEFRLFPKEDQDDLLVE